MPPVRHLLAQRYLAGLICAAALLLRLLVPTGYMIDTAGGRLAVIVCAGAAPMVGSSDMPGMRHGAMPGHATAPDPGKSDDHGKGQMPCAFSSLSSAMLGTLDPLQLAVLIAFVLATGLVAMHLPALSRPAHLRPPLRGPPAYR